MFKNKINYLLLSLFILILIIIIGYLLYINFILEEKNSKINNNIRDIDNSANAKICLSLEEYKKLLDNNYNKPKIINEKSKEDTIERDRKVLDDDLYPPLNRGDNVSHTKLANNINNRRMYINTQETGDTYRLVAYVSSTSNIKDSGNNNWKLFARQKDRHISDFYMIPTDNTNDLKISITNDIVIGNKLRDIYDIPQQIIFNSPLLNKEAYNVVEVPKADLSRSADYI